MKRFIYLPLSIAMLGIPALAANCATGTLASYIKLGTAGCMLGNLHVGSFTYKPPASVIGIGPDQITVTPLLVPVGTVALQFAAPWSVNTGQSELSQIGYKVVALSTTSKGPTIQEVRLTGSGFEGGVITNAIVSETLGATSVASNLQVYEKCTGTTPVCNTQTSAMENLVKPAVSLIVLDKVTLNSKSGSTSLQSFEDWFVTCAPCVF